MKKLDRTHWLLTLCFGFVVMVVIGCQAPSQGGRTYTRDQAQRPLQVFYGTVLQVSDVQIQGTESGAGAIGGVIVGGIVGSTIGSGRTLATTGGALAGSAAESGAEQARATRPGLEIEVEMDDGRILVVVQEKDDEFAVGDRIRLVTTPDGTYRIRQ